MILQQWNRVIRRENPVIERGLRTLRRSKWGHLPRVFHPSEARRVCLRAACFLKQRRRRPVEQLPRPQLLQLFLHASQRSLAREFGGSEFSRRQVQRSKTHPLS